jgi:hypothetical protein
MIVIPWLGFYTPVRENRAHHLKVNFFKKRVLPLRIRQYLTSHLSIRECEVEMRGEGWGVET